jgi:hypothetical protein
MRFAIWLAVFFLAVEAITFGNGWALITGLLLATIGMILEARKT